MVNARELGQAGEELAARYLERRGMVVLARNWRCAGPDVRGELDIVARDARALVFCEVKTRRDDTSGGPLAAITPAKQRQLRRLAAAYLTATRQPRRRVRLDVIAITWPTDGGAPHLHHLRGVGR
jgi:putative endonuclease